MFRCQHCGTVTPPRVSAETIVVKSRLQTYPFREDAHRITDCRRHRNPHPVHDDPGGNGREIVREIRVCLPCKQSLQMGQTVPTS
jgi:hypothetical protein